MTSTALEPQIPAFDPLAAAFLQAPYPAVAALRAELDVAYAPAIDMWVVTRYADVDAVFRDPATFSAAIAQAPLTPVADEAKVILAAGFGPPAVMSNLDPPEHARIRQHTVRAFSARRLALLEPTIRARAAALIDGFAGKARVDFVRELSFPLPAVTIFTMIGFPDEDTELLKSYCAERMAFSWGRPSAAEQVRIARQMVSYWNYCEAFVARRVHEPADDFTSDLLQTAREKPGTLAQKEIASIIYGLSFAGHETTTNLLSNSVRQLLEHRESWDAICADPRRIPDAVEEALRYDTSVITWRRVTTRAARIGSVDVPAGAKLLLLLCSANHDAAQFPEPDRFDINRKDARKHLSFGMGIHFCLGAGLARMEDAIVLELLSKRFPRLSLVTDQHYTFHPNVAFRGPQELWLNPGA
jgi:cytochrome P450